jgi:hypothetical protein
VSQPDSFAREKILQSALEIVREQGSSEVEFATVAVRSGVELETVEYFFNSRTELVGEAQLANYFEMVEPHHLVLNRIENAESTGDESTFWEAIEQSIEMAWASGQEGQKWGIIKILLDIWIDPFSQNHFSELLDIQFERWISVVDKVKERGWIDSDIDAAAMVSVFWSASVGQVITAGSSFLNVSPLATREFLLRVVRGRSQHGSTLN